MAPYADAPGPDAVALRLLGSVHRLVLQRRAGVLGAWYPSVGGTWEPESGWAAFRDLVAAQPEAVAEWLDRAPQTNEVGRAAALFGGLLALAARGERRPVRLVEIGASAGLNLLVDRFRYTGGGLPASGAGPLDSPVHLTAWSGPPPFPTDHWPDVVAREGTDVRPIDATGTEGRLALTAYVWADQRERLERLRGALALAQGAPPPLRVAGAADTLAALEPRADVVTVVWHSVMWQYLEPAEQARAEGELDRLARSAGPDVAHLRLEPVRRTPAEERRFWLVLDHAGERSFLATTPGHGVPLTWA
ncbi:DUF2332 domain-containing protein [Nocardioides sp.]|uniref:DUF2332 domain-containing protein n=1 Tax=Nocardioides sp. TaxID=35761 RepID=UPI0035190614